MAIAPVNKFISIAVPVAPGLQELYEVPTGSSALVLYAQVANVGIGTYPTVTFIQRRESRSTGLTRDIRIIKDAEVPPNDAVILVDGRMVLEKTPLIVDRVLISGIQTGISTVNDVQYSEPTGIVTVTTLDAHGLTVGEQITLGGIAFTCANNSSGITTTIFPDPQKSYIIDSIEGSVGTSKTFSANVGSANGIIHYYVPARHKFIKSVRNAITLSGGGTYTPTNASYEPQTGIVTLTIPGHNMISATSHTPNGAYYTPSTGIMTVTTATAHGFSTGDLIKFDNDALKFKCSFDNYVGLHTYPRTTDPASSTWKSITVGTGTDFTLNVGSSPMKCFSISGAEYTASTGIMTAVIGSHDLRVGTSVGIASTSLTFTCAQDNHATQHHYPRPNGYGGATSDDPAYNSPVNITAVSDTTITLDVGTSSYTGIHTFVSPTNLSPTSAAYNGVVGIMTLTVPNHGLVDGEYIKISDSALTFTCTLDGDVAQKKYPRSTDPISDTFIKISNATTNTFEVQVLSTTPSTNTNEHTFVSATPNSVVRAVIVSGAADYTHRFDSAVTNGMKRSTDSVGIATESLVFSCSQDGYQTEHRYPRTTDPAHDTTLGIVESTPSTISVNVGVSTAGGLVAPLQMEFLASILENSNA